MLRSRVAITWIAHVPARPDVGTPAASAGAEATGAGAGGGAVAFGFGSGFTSSSGLSGASAAVLPLRVPGYESVSGCLSGSSDGGVGASAGAELTVCGVDGAAVAD